jgi:antitoxin ParD1/3/4
MWSEDEKLEKLRAAVQIGDEQLVRGEGSIYSPETLDKITEKALTNSRNGIKINDDIAP